MCTLSNARAALPPLQTQFLATYESEAEGWRGGLQPYGPMSLLPSSQALNYGQSIFEGMKVSAPAQWLLGPLLGPIRTIPTVEGMEVLSPAQHSTELRPVHLRGHEGMLPWSDTWLNSLSSSA